MDGLLNNLTTEEGFDELEAYLLENATGRDLVDSLLYIDGRQTIISFQANTLDWQATVDFEEGLSQALQDAATTVDGSFTMELSGRALILAQISADVAISAVTSTAIVAFTILFVLILIQFVRTQSLTQAVLRWRHLDSSDHRCSVGLRHHGSCRIPIEFSNSYHWCSSARVGC